MNLDQIATKCFILALFIRDDGQRLLLGDGYYDFNQKLQHFQGNTIANDIVEIQGDNGQLLAGQVMRSGAQKFEGYIGDATTSRQIIEQKRSDFMAFFRIKHFYKVVYIFPDGTAIQRQRGYLTDAPTIPEIFQKFPEYSIALNFEDANYYEYAEDEHGDEIYAHIIELALSGNATGGLVWDAIGAVSNGISWSGIQTAQGEYISITNELSLEAPLASVEMLGNAEQSGTPTPDAPIYPSSTTGENTTRIEGKNLIGAGSEHYPTAAWYNLDEGTTITTTTSGATVAETANGLDITLAAAWYGVFFIVPVTAGQAYHIKINASGTGCRSSLYWLDANKKILRKGGVLNTNPLSLEATLAVNSGEAYIALALGSNTATTIAVTEPQLELGSTATAYEPYQGQTLPVNLGKNLFSGDYSQFNEQGGAGSTYAYFKLPTDGIYTLTLIAKNDISSSGGRYLGFSVNGGNADVGINWLWSGGSTITKGEQRTITNKPAVAIYHFVSMYPKNQATLEWFMENFDIQLELGSQATSYSAYFTPIELAKIGNHQDRIYKTDGKWYIEKQVGKVVWDGTESWSGGNGQGGYYSFFRADSSIKLNTANEVLTLSDHFTSYGTPTDVINNAIIGLTTRPSTSGQGFYVRSNLNTSSISAWTTWLSTHNTIVYYALATPTTTEITNETLIAQLDALESASLYLGVNNIGTETLNAVPTLKIEYYTEVDLDGAGYEWEPGGNTAKTIVTVAGVDSAWPIWTVQGGAQNPTLTNITTGQTITWQGFVPEGQTLTINMAEMTADLAGANVFEYVTGEWIRLAPGNNTLVYTAGSADKPSTLSWNGVLA